MNPIQTLIDLLALLALVFNISTVATNVVSTPDQPTRTAAAVESVGLCATFPIERTADNLLITVNYNDVTYTGGASPDTIRGSVVGSFLNVSFDSSDQLSADQQLQSVDVDDPAITEVTVCR